MAKPEKANKLKTMSWTVRFTVSANWVEDGFELDEETARDMIEKRLPWAYSHELTATIVRAPSQKKIRRVQGY